MAETCRLRTTMTTLLYTFGGFLVGLLTMALIVIRLNRLAEHQEFKRFWGA